MKSTNTVRRNMTLKQMHEKINYRKMNLNEI